MCLENEVMTDKKSDDLHFWRRGKLMILPTPFGQSYLRHYINLMQPGHEQIFGLTIYFSTFEKALWVERNSV